jgi:hypothetical protein
MSGRWLPRGCLGIQRKKTQENDKTEKKAVHHPTSAHSLIHGTAMLKAAF